MVLGSVVNEPNWYPWGFGFDPWPCSVGWGSSTAMSCGEGHKCGSDLALLWLWHRSAGTPPQIQHLVWEPPYASGAALNKTKDQKTKKKKNGIRGVAAMLQ